MMYKHVLSIAQRCLISTRTRCNPSLPFRLLNSSTSLQSNSLINFRYHMEALVNDIIKAPETRSVTNKVNQFCEHYHEADQESKNNLIKQITNLYSIDIEAAERAAKTFLANKQNGELHAFKAVNKLGSSLKPLYLNLFERIARSEDGVKFLVDMRSDLLDATKTIDNRFDETTIRQIRKASEHLKDLLSLYFSVGFLNFERVTWNSPCYMLQKISDYEAVHPMRNWTDLKRRVGPYRRCYVITSSCLPKEPLVILHVALTSDISSSIKDIVKTFNIFNNEGNDHLSNIEPDRYSTLEDPNKFCTAIFYSISSTQKGLHGIELGTQMIREVGKIIRSEFPHITKFSSLSPIPGFRDYLISEIESITKANSTTVANFLTAEEYNLLEKHLLTNQQNSVDVWSYLLKELRANTWINDDKLAEVLHIPLMRKCAHYLYNEKRRGYALNPVAHFHMRNGSVMWRLNWKADLSPRGLNNSFGIMMNYRYYFETADDNSQNYIEEKIIPSSDIFSSHLISLTSRL